MKRSILPILYFLPWWFSFSAEPPNVLLIYTDDHARWAVGAYGNQDVHTPTMDKLAADGMRFDRGFTKPVCSPSRAMVLTGLLSHRLGIPDFIPHGNPVVSGNGLPPGTPTIASVLKRRGYRTGLVGKWHLGYGEKYYPDHFGFDVAEGYRYIAPGKQIDSVGAIPFLVEGREIPRFRYDKQHTDVLADRAIHFLKEESEKPFFLFLSIYLPHLPWNAIPERDRAHYEGKQLSIPDLSPFPEVNTDKERLHDLTADYYANITCADRNIGRVLATLDEQDLAEDTIVFFIGDNGFNVGQHGLLGKGNARVLDSDRRRPNMFDHSVMVPFIVRWPGVVAPGSSSRLPVSSIDVLPTLVELCRTGDDLKLDGRSLLPILRGDPVPTWRDAMFETYDMNYLDQSYMRMIRTDDFKLVLHFGADGFPLLDGARHELFDLRQDPEELDNLYSNAEYDRIRRKLEQRLLAWMAETEVGNGSAR